MAQSETQIVAYADNLVLIARNKKILHEILSVLESEAKNRGLSINKKTENN